MRHGDYIDGPLRDFVDYILNNGSYAINFYAIVGVGDLKNFYKEEEYLNKTITHISHTYNDYVTYITLNRGE